MNGRSERFCACGAGYLLHGVRIGPGMGETTRVLLCPTCSYEEPSLYDRSRAQRDGKNTRDRRRFDDRVIAQAIGGFR